jgi:uncharacterized protein (DUF488 family)
MTSFHLCRYLDVLHVSHYHGNMKLYTIGHSTRTLDELLSLLQTHGIIREHTHIPLLADIRTIPRSRTNPQFNAEVLAVELSARGIAYIHLARLGGLRKPRPDSPNTAWRNASFRGFADYMATPSFTSGLEELLEFMHSHVTTIMCAEALPWRCHRSLVADALTIRGIDVYHIINTRNLQLHRLTHFAQVEGLTITYPASEQDSDSSVER